MKIVFTLICIFFTFCTYGQRGVVGYDAVVEGKQYTLVDVQTEYLNVCIPEHVFLNIIDNEELETTWCITAVYKRDTAWEMEWSEVEISLSIEEMNDLKLTANLYYNLDEFLYGKDQKNKVSQDKLDDKKSSKIKKQKKTKKLKRTGFVGYLPDELDLG